MNQTGMNQADTNPAGIVEIHTDGACSGNPGPGGWGAVLMYRGASSELSGGEAATTNNRMELMAAIRALEALSRPSRVRLHTDSTYVKEGITSWINRWKANGWKTAARKPVGAHAEAGPGDVDAHGAGEVGGAVGHHHHLVADVLVLAPGVHYEDVVDREADDEVDALGLERVGALNEARQVLVGTGRREGAGHGEGRHPLGGEQLVRRNLGRAVRAHVLEGDGRDALADLDGHGSMVMA